MSRQCFFRCILDSHAPIKLLHGVETIVGRSKITKIKDQSCSRQQISLKADCEQCIVEIKQIGINPSGLDGFALKRDKVYKVKHGSRVEVLLNNYFHIMEFDPPPNEAGTKRKSEEEQTPPRKKILLNTEMEGVSSSIKEASENVWENIDKDELYVYTTKGVKSRAKIAAFDMDGTLIKPKSGRVFPVNLNDWQIIFPQVAPKLKECIENDFKLVILSNQAPIGNGRVKIEDFMKKIEKIVETLNVPIQVYIATGNSLYRKPRTGMWRILTEQKNDGLEIDMAESFYCGDAAGRLANWAPGKKKDHSMADKLMAENIGLKFYTPEQYFLGHSISNVPMAKPEFNPRDIMPEPFKDNLIRDEQEIIVLVGYPGSGKSFLSSQIEKKSDHRYRAVCRDYMGTWQKCATEAKKLLQQGRSVVIDSTNPDVESRGRWVWLAKEMRVQVRCAKLTATKPHAQHNNKFRQLMKIDHLHVSEIIYHTYKNKYVEPALTEGFSEIIEVNFNPTFDDKEAEAIYNMYLLEK